MIYAIGTLAYIAAFWARKKLKIFAYEIVIAIIYLITLSYIQTLDITLVLYLVFAVLPFIKWFSAKGYLEIIVLFYFLISLVVSIVLNGTSAISVFAIRLIGLLFYIYFFSKISLSQNQLGLNKKNSILNLILLFAIGETLIGCIGFALSGSTRLMLNYQCTVGALSIAGVLLCILFLNENKGNHIKTFLAFAFLIYFCVWIVLSGTRGYIVIGIGMTAIAFLLYCPTKIKVAIIAISVFIVLCFWSYIYEPLMEILRLDESTGRRGSENLFVWYYMKQGSIFNFLFGYGFGQVVGELDNVSLLLSEVSNSDYTYYILHTVSGFHNLYATVYYSSGLVGVILVVGLFIKVLLRLNKIPVLKLRLALLAYVLIYMFIIWYRWTATSGILEFATIAFIEQYIKNKYPTKQKQTTKLKRLPIKSN